MHAERLPLTSTPETVPRRKPEALVQHFEEESLLMDPASAYTCALNPTGAAVWELIDGQRSVAEIAAVIVRSTTAVPMRANEDVRLFIDEMARLGFVRFGRDGNEVDDDGVDSGPPFTAALKRLIEAVTEEAQRYEHEVADAQRCDLFVPSHPARLFGAMQAARRHTSRFVELGSGLGGNTLLAALLGYEPATGVEHDAELHRRSQRLAAELGLEERVTFHLGNYLPADYEPPADVDATTLARYRLDGERVFEQADVPAHDCWLATPFPQTQRVVEHLFHENARPGSLLLTYQGLGPAKIRIAAGDTLTYYGPESDAQLARMVENESG